MKGLISLKSRSYKSIKKVLFSLLGAGGGGGVGGEGGGEERGEERGLRTPLAPLNDK